MSRVYSSTPNNFLRSYPEMIVQDVHPALREENEYSDEKEMSARSNTEDMWHQDAIRAITDLRLDGGGDKMVSIDGGGDKMLSTEHIPSRSVDSVYRIPDDHHHRSHSRVASAPGNVPISRGAAQRYRTPPKYSLFPSIKERDGREDESPSSPPSHSPPPHAISPPQYDIHEEEMVQHNHHHHCCPQCHGYPPEKTRYERPSTPDTITQARYHRPTSPDAQRPMSPEAFIPSYSRPMSPSSHMEMHGHSRATMSTATISSASQRSLTMTSDTQSSRFQPSSLTHEMTPISSSASSQHSRQNSSNMIRRTSAASSDIVPDAAFIMTASDRRTSSKSSSSSKNSNKKGSRIKSMLKSSTPLMDAAKSGDALEVRRLLGCAIQSKSISATDRDGFTALHHASKLGHNEVVKVLLALTDGPIEGRTKQNDRTALFLAVQNNCVDVVSTLLAAGAAINVSSKMDGATALHKAAQLGNEECLLLLLRSGADVNKRDIEGMPPLMWAISSKKPEVVKLLVAHGANLEARIRLGANLELSSAEGMTVLLKSVIAGNHAFVRLFLELGADPNAIGPGGVKALHRACSKGDVLMVEILLEFNASVVDQSNEGWTPLHFAARYGFRRVYGMLLEAGADEGTVNNAGETAREIGRRNGYGDLFW